MKNAAIVVAWFFDLKLGGTMTEPLRVFPPFFAEYVKWLLDRDPEYARRLIQRWEKNRAELAAGHGNHPGGAH
jgi:hypothetical protein